MNEPQPDGQDALPLDELQIAPEWVKSGTKSYEDHSGQDRAARGDRRDRGPRPPRGPSPEPGGVRPPRRTDRRPERDRLPARPPGPARPQAPAPAPVDVAFLPEDKGFNAMIETMKHSRLAYALFDVAKLILNKPERHLVRLTRLPAADGTRAPLSLLTSTGSPFLSQDEALRFIFRRQGEGVFKETRKPIDPPKGNFSFVNRCGLTGEWLGPPNYHEYQSRLVRHHQQRLRHMPFEEFKGRIQTVRDPDAVKAWIESKSFTMEYQCLLDAEPTVFTSRADLEKHIVENHLAQLVTDATELIINGPSSRQIDHAGVLEAIREAWMAERRFPLKTANYLSERLRKEGFHFFKHGKGITYISYIKPNRFETTEGLAEHIQKLVAFLRKNSNCKRKQVLEQLVPTPAPGEQAAPPQPGTTTEADRFLSDLHWLIQDGYIVEFSDGRLWALEDRPPKPPAPPPEDREVAAAPVAATGATEEPAAAEPQPTAEASPTPAPETPVVPEAPTTSQEASA